MQVRYLTAGCTRLDQGAAFLCGDARGDSIALPFTASQGFLLHLQSQWLGSSASLSAGAHTQEANSCLDFAVPILDQVLKVLVFLEYLALDQINRLKSNSPFPGQTFWYYRCGLWRGCCFWHLSNSKEFAFSAHVPKSLNRTKEMWDFLFYAVMSTCHIICYLLGSKLLKLRGIITYYFRTSLWWYLLQPVSRMA